MRILISAPYFLPVVENYRSRLEAEGMELVVADVRERLREQELLQLISTIHGATDDVSNSCIETRFTICLRV